MGSQFTIHLDDDRPTKVGADNHIGANATSGYLSFDHDDTYVSFHGDWSQLRDVLTTMLSQVDRLAGNPDEGRRVVLVESATNAVDEAFYATVAERNAEAVRGVNTTDPYEPHIHLDIPVTVARDYASANLARHSAAARFIEEQIDAALVVHTANETGVDDLMATLRQLVDESKANAEVVPADDAFATPLLSRVQARQGLPTPAVRRAIRVAAGESQTACAEALGVSRQGFAHWEAGTRNPKGGHVTDYLELLRSLQQAVGDVHVNAEACTGFRYAINPDFPDEGTDIRHEAACPFHGVDAEAVRS